VKGCQTHVLKNSVSVSSPQLAIKANAQRQIQTRRLGGSRIGGSRKGIHLIKYPRLSATIVGYRTKVVTFCRPREWLFLLVELCDLSGNNHNLKALYIIHSERV